MEQVDKKKVVIVGSGMMVPALLADLAKDFEVHIASNLIKDAEALAEPYDNVSCEICDVTNLDQMTEIIKGFDLAISYVPPFLHKNVANACINASTHLVTASYIDDDMKSFDEEAKKKGLTFLNEIGLDPGIDIMSTMKVKDEVEGRGAKIVSYQSWCGGLPDGINSDNPLMYKFSWAPQAVFKTSKNKAVFLKDGQIVTIPGEELLTTGTESKDFHPAFKLEGYPNRDSVAFKDDFGMKDAESFVRGTLRFEGFGVIMRGLHNVGITSEDEFDQDKKSMKEVVLSLAPANPTEDALKLSVLAEIPFGTGAEAEEKKALASRLVDLVQETEPKKLKKIIKSWDFFEFYNSTELSRTPKKPLDALCEICLKKMDYGEGGRDLVVMKHIFGIEEADETRRTLESTFVATGDLVGSGGNSVMCKTVGLPTSLGAKLILSGKVNAPGVISPRAPEFYEPILAALEEAGFKVVEEYV